MTSPDTDRHLPADGSTARRAHDVIRSDPDRTWTTPEVMEVLDDPDITSSSVASAIVQLSGRADTHIWRVARGTYQWRPDLVQNDPGSSRLTDTGRRESVSKPILDSAWVPIPDADIPDPGTWLDGQSVGTSKAGHTLMVLDGAVWEVQVIVAARLV